MLTPIQTKLISLKTTGNYSTLNHHRSTEAVTSQEELLTHRPGDQTHRHLSWTPTCGCSPDRGRVARNSPRLADESTRPQLPPAGLTGPHRGTRADTWGWADQRFRKVICFQQNLRDRDCGCRQWSFSQDFFFFNVVNQPDSQDRLQRHQEKKQTSEAEDKISDRLDYPWFLALDVWTKICSWTRQTWPVNQAFLEFSSWIWTHTRLSLAFKQTFV